MEERVMNFTKKGIEEVEPPTKGRLVISDEKNRYLRLRVSSNGHKVFYYVRRHNGKIRWIQLGTFPEMTINQARERCHAISHDIAEGIDPIEEKRKCREYTTLGELYERYMELHAKPRKRSWETDAFNYKNHLSPWKNKPLSEISTEAISRLHTKMRSESGLYSANRTLALLKSMFTFAIKQGLYEGPNPGMKVTMFKETSRRRFLQGEELIRFFKALETEPSHDMRDLFLLALYTGARRGNVQAMKWCDIDFERAVWTVQGDESKNAEDMEIVLVEDAVNILRHRQTNMTISSEFVFPSTSKTGHITEPKRAWKNLLQRAGIKDLRIHDLRRTLGSWQAAGGASLLVIGKSLGHRNLNTTAVYSRLDLYPVRVSVNNAVKAMIHAAKEE